VGSTLTFVQATAATQLAFGKCYTVLPIKWVYITAIVFFEVGSALCGAAPNSDALIVGRAIAGMGSAGIFSGALIIIAHR
jgi:MFS family permease